MTDREKAIVMAYTGACMLTGYKFQIFHKYIEDIMGRPVYIHELADKDVNAEIKEKAKADFIALCGEQESYEDYVSRKAIIKTLNEMDRYIADELILCESGNKFPLNEVYIVDDVYEEIEKLPSVRPAQKTGKWIKAYTEEKYISLRDKITVSTYMCSECGRMINNIGAGPFASRIEGYPYCHCGAKMIGVEK